MRHAFLSRSVAECYDFRPPYSSEVIACLLRLLGIHPRSVLDAGCGHGKLARELVDQVDRVDAVDRSDEMLRVGRSLPGGDHPKLNWICGEIEDVELAGPYGLVVAGASFHWFDPERVLTRFADLLAHDAVFALVEGDTPWQAPWAEAELELIGETAELRTGERPELRAPDVEAPFDFPLIGFERLGALVTSPSTVEQPIESYLACQNSRASLSQEALGPKLAERFDRELRRILEPYSRGDRIRYELRTRIEWASPADA